MNAINENTKRIIAELIATFTFVFLGVGAVGAASAANVQFGSALIWIAIGHGIGITLGIIVFGRISGAHINPAVTFAALIAGRIYWVDAIRYMAAQLFGAIVAILLLRVGFGQVENLGVHAISGNINVGQGLVIEIILTFILVFTVFAAAMDKRALALFAPFAVGLVVLAEHLVAVPLTGASMNPARSFGPALLSNAWADHWVYWVGPLIGAALAAVAYTIIFGDENDRRLMRRAPANPDS